MKQIASEHNVQQLQQIFDCLGRYGGIIRTADPKKDWDLKVYTDDVTELEEEEFLSPRKLSEDEIQIVIGMSNGTFTDPQFLLVAKMDDDKLKEVEIMYRFSRLITGNFYTTNDDMFIMYGANGEVGKEKDDEPLKKQFTEFLALATRDVYLKNPAEVEKFTNYVSKMY